MELIHGCCIQEYYGKPSFIPVPSLVRARNPLFLLPHSKNPRDSGRILAPKALLCSKLQKKAGKGLENE